MSTEQTPAAATHAGGPRTDPTPQPVTHASGPGAGMPLVAGRCPACRGAALHLGAGGHVTCARLECPDPGAADDLLHAGDLSPWAVPADAASRREWVAAYRDGATAVRAFAGTVANPDTCADVLEARASLVEAGELTPWAGQADLASGPDVQSQPADRLARGGPAILGRALLDDRGELWWPRPEREQSAYGRPVREVLLVDPSVARVLDAARVVADAQQKATPEWLAALRALTAAMVALPDAGTDTPTATGQASKAPGASMPTVPAVEWHPTITGATRGPYSCGQKPAGDPCLRCLEPAENHPAEPTPEPGTEDAFLAAIAEPADPRLSEVQAAARAAGGRLDVEVVPDPEPASGPGSPDRRAWTRQQWLDDARAIFDSVHGGAADLLNGHIMALFGELHDVTEQRDLAIAHDRQPYPTAAAYEAVCATLERKRAELAEVTADRDRLSNTIAAAGQSAMDSAEYARQGWDEVERLRAAVERVKARTEPAPEPASGPGWDREAERGAPVDWRLIAEQRERELRIEGERKYAMQRERDELRADRDRLREHSTTLNAIAWKLATALGDVPAGADAIRGNPEEQADRLIAELHRLRVLVGEEGQPGWDGCSRAEAIRQAEDKHEFGMRMSAALETVKDDLLAAREEVDRLRAELATARRDAAADALDEAANDASGLNVATGERYFTGAALRELAAQLRRGARPAPGSPQPDGGGDDDD